MQTSKNENRKTKCKHRKTKIEKRNANIENRKTKIEMQTSKNENRNANIENRKTKCKHRKSTSLVPPQPQLPPYSQSHERKILIEGRKLVFSNLIKSVQCIQYQTFLSISYRQYLQQKD